jgi:hypothetical protein
VPHVSQYGLNAFRDAALWGYGTFGIVTASLLLNTGWLQKAIDTYSRVLPWFLFWVPISQVVSWLAQSAIPRVLGTDVPLLHLKAGDIAVHLAGAAAFLLLGIKSGGYGWREWPLWMAWLAGLISASFNRGALVTVIGVLTANLIFKPLGRWGKAFLTSALIITALVATDVEFSIGGRTVSPMGMIDNLQSTLSTSGDQRDATRAWRLEWWGTIVNYTIFGDYFWTGKGYGVNLASSDGYGFSDDEPLRNPHNGHLTVLARGGVPSAVVWFLLQASFAVSLFRVYRRSRDSLFLWVLLYWAAFMSNAAFDVYLEGPQGGIWFWCVFGLGLALLIRDHERERAARAASACTLP